LRRPGTDPEAAQVDINDRKPTLLMTTRSIIVGISLFCALAPAARGQSGLVLPTPRDHYKTYNVESARLALMTRVLNEVDPETRKQVVLFLGAGANTGDLPRMKPEDVIRFVRGAGLLKYKPEILEILVHSSQVLETVPAKYFEIYGPIIHDALLAFFDGLNEERMIDRAMALANAKDASRGEKILIFASRIPTLQKIGQIIARVEGIPPDIQQSLQSLENDIRTMNRDELVAYVEKELGGEQVRKYDLQFDDRILAEASVGAVIFGSFQPPGELSKRQNFVCKVIKPYVVSGLPEEMRSIDRLITLVTESADFYQIEDFNLKDFFADVRVQLENEIKVSEEQAHFRKAYEFYKNHAGVRVPEVFHFSTERVTFMEFLNIQKLTESFLGDQKSRRILADRLATVMTFEALFSEQHTSIFHGDPHGGNIMRITDDPKDPYKLALLDWGLMGEFPREQRMEMVQLSLAYSQKSKKRMVRNVGSLIKGGLPKDPQKLAGIEEMVGRAMEVKGGTFEAYGALLEELFKAGYALEPQFSLFIKSQLTIAGILRELDPTLNQNKLVRKKTTGLIMKEFPKRLVLLPAWNYRGYRSMLSNGDIFREIF
jgi:ubiquinone biosynthesis protein